MASQAATQQAPQTNAGSGTSLLPQIHADANGSYLGWYCPDCAQTHRVSDYYPTEDMLKMNLIPSLMRGITDLGHSPSQS